MCLYPTIRLNKKYLPNKKNGGKPPKLDDERKKYVPTGCQQCIECRKQKARGWQVRLLEDLREYQNGKFITLTFNNNAYKHYYDEIQTEAEKITTQAPEGYELDNEIATRAVRDMLERWRKKHGKSLRHWLVTELGHNGTENIHIHGIIWTNETTDEIVKHWNGGKHGENGYVWRGTAIKGKNREPVKWVNYVNERTVNYIVKYIHKADEDHKGFKSKVLTSPGIGSNYLSRWDSTRNKFNEDRTIETYRTRTGHKIAMPIYWRNKIYTDQEREKLWIYKLDKQERWICGERVDISKDETDYYKLLEYYRERNRELGYGTGEITWHRKQYEQQRRKLMQEKRLEPSNTEPRPYGTSEGSALRD